LDTKLSGGKMTFQERRIVLFVSAADFHGVNTVTMANYMELEEPRTSNSLEPL
jgi:hypothetical protein